MRRYFDYRIVNAARAVPAEAWFVGLIVLVSSLVYALTLCPTVYMGDSGELSATAITAGIAHSPGYPLFVILGFIFSKLIPGAGSALDINLFSAFFGCATLLLFYGMMRYADCPRITACATALTFGFINPVWSQAVVARVYTLNNALMVGALWCLFAYERTGRWRMMQWYALVLGFGLANNPLSVLTVPVAVCYLFTVPPCAKLRLKQIIVTPAWLLPGLTLYAYLPLRALFDPRVHWGKPGIDRSLWRYILRSEYTGRQYVQSVSDALEVIRHYLSLLPLEYTAAGCAVIALGIYISAKKSMRMTISLFLMYSLNIVLMIAHSPHTDIFFWPRYVLPSFISVCVWFGFGLQHISATFLRRRWARIAVFAMPLWLITANFHDNNRSGQYLAFDYGMFILNQLPRGAHLVSAGEDTITFSLIYLHRARGIRPDIKLYTPGVVPGEMPPEMPDGADLFTTRDTLFESVGVACVPYGLVFKVAAPEQEIPQFTDWDVWRVRNLYTPDIHFDYTARTLLGNYYFMRALNCARSSMESALEYIHKALQTGHDVAGVQYNAGSFLLSQGYTADARRCFERVRAINRHISIPDI